MKDNIVEARAHVFTAKRLLQGVENNLNRCEDILEQADELRQRLIEQGAIRAPKKSKYIRLHDISDSDEVIKFRVEEIDSIEPIAHGTRVYVNSDGDYWDVVEDYATVDDMLSEYEEG